MKLRALSPTLLLTLLFGGLLGAALPASPLWFAIPPLLVAFLAVMVAGRSDRGFLLLCTGELLVAASGAGIPWSILPLQCLLVAVILAEPGLFTTGGDLLWFGVYSLAACGALGLVILARNILLSTVIAVVLFSCVYLGLALGEHEQQRALSGGSP